MGEGDESLVDDLLEADKQKVIMSNTVKCLDHGYVRLVDYMGSDQSIVEAARVSYLSPSKGDEADKKLLFRLYRDMHTSPFEMGKIVFNIKLPIFVMRQFVRHRMQNLNEVSARYRELPNEFYFPDVWRKQKTAGNKQGSEGEVSEHGYCDVLCKKACDSAYTTYMSLLSFGVAREMARMVLPVNIYTEIYCCWDMKNLLHFIRLREDSHAQAEIQVYARAMKEIARQLFPWTMEAYDRFKVEVTDKLEDFV